MERQQRCVSPRPQGRVPLAAAPVAEMPEERRVKTWIVPPAPVGYAEIMRGVLRPNPINRRPELFDAKAASYVARWPWLTVLASGGDEAMMQQ